MAEASLADNPLLKPSQLPYGAPPFDQIKTEHFEPAVMEGIRLAREEVAAIKNNPEPPTFDNTIAALRFTGETLDFSGTALDRVWMIFHNISIANGNEEIRELKSKLSVERIKFHNEVSFDDDLFARIKAVYDVKDSLSLTSEQNVLLNFVYKRFTDNGALLGEEDKAKLGKMNEKLAELGSTFSNNATAADKAYIKVIDNEDALKGLPERVKNNFKEAAIEEKMPDKWVIRLSPPPSDVVEYSDDRALREEIFRAMRASAWKDQWDNSQNTIEIVKLRQEKARLLGYAGHAEYVLKNKMAKTPEAVKAFLARNRDVYKPAHDEYIKQVADFALQKDGLTELKPWDVLYYGRQLKEQIFDLDEESFRPYLNLERVLEGVRAHAEKLFGVKIVEVNDKYPKYDPEVKVYEVRDAKSGEILGLFYGDYYARAGLKNGNAWMELYRGRGDYDGVNQIPIVTNVCNFDKPTAQQPTLLSLDEVTTVFHEFGHALHNLLALGRYPALTGSNVKTDFVELPSQVQERWALEPEVLNTFARHYQTGELLPAELIKKMKDSENFGAGYWGLRQTFFGMLDMKWHTTDPSKIHSTEQLEDEVIKETGIIGREGAGPLSVGFEHFFSMGYDVGYYSYKWSEVLDANVFAKFKEKGLYDPELSALLRETIYSKGGTIEPDVLFRMFMGSDPNPDALFEREGLLKKKKEPLPPKQAAGGGLHH